MSAGGRRREIAHRLFATEFDVSTVTITDSDEEMAPTFVLTPTGALVNRVFVVGALTEVDQVGDDVYRGRIHDPTGTFIAYAGQYQPDAANFLADAQTPTFVSLTAKARTFEPEGSSQVLTSLRPERLTVSDTTERDRWVTEAARYTLARIEWFARARVDSIADEDIEEHLRSLGVRGDTAKGIALAVAEYGTSATYLKALRDRVKQALEVTFADGESVRPIEIDPGDTRGAETFDDLATDHFADLLVDPDVTPQPTPAVAAVDTGVSVEAEATPGDEVEPQPEPTDIDFDPDEEFELSAQERARIEEEFGTEFETGSSIEPSDTESVDETVEPQVAIDDEPDDDSSPPAADDPDTTPAEAEVDLEASVIEHMRELDNGDGVDRARLIEAVSDTTGASASAVDNAIQDALMSGTCYEPTEDHLKPI